MLLRNSYVNKWLNKLINKLLICSVLLSSRPAACFAHLTLSLQRHLYIHRRQLQSTAASKELNALLNWLCRCGVLCEPVHLALLMWAPRPRTASLSYWRADTDIHLAYIRPSHEFNADFMAIYTQLTSASSWYKLQSHEYTLFALSVYWPFVVTLLQVGPYVLLQ